MLGFWAVSPLTVSLPRLSFETVCKCGLAVSRRAVLRDAAIGGDGKFPPAFCADSNGGAVWGRPRLAPFHHAVRSASPATRRRTGSAGRADRAGALHGSRARYEDDTRAGEDVLS